MSTSFILPNPLTERQVLDALGPGWWFEPVPQDHPWDPNPIALTDGDVVAWPAYDAENLIRGFETFTDWHNWPIHAALRTLGALSEHDPGFWGLVNDTEP